MLSVTCAMRQWHITVGFADDIVKTDLKYPVTAAVCFYHYLLASCQASSWPSLRPDIWLMLILSDLLSGSSKALKSCNFRLISFLIFHEVRRGGSRLVDFCLSWVGLQQKNQASNW